MEGKIFFWKNIFRGAAWTAAFLLFLFFLGLAWKAATPWMTREAVFAAALAVFILALCALKRFIARKGARIFSFSLSVWRSIKRAILENSDVRRMAEKHSSFFGFIRRRTDKSKFFGLPATLLSLAFVYVFLLFAGIVGDVVAADVVVSADTRVANLLALFRSPAFTEFFLWVTALGKWQVVLIFTFAAVGLLWLRRERAYIVPLLVTLAGAVVSVSLGKLAVHRARPEAALYAEHSFSFPSGHAAIAIAFYGFLVYALIRGAKHWKAKVNLFFSGIALILLIGFSRLYLGVHYVSDVWGGYLAGALWLIIGIGLSEWLSSKRKTAGLDSPKGKKRAISAILIFAALLFYAGFAAEYHPLISRPSDRRDGKSELASGREIVARSVGDIFSNKQLRYTETLSGSRQEPVSFIIFARDDADLLKAFTNSGWFLADKATASSLVKLAETAVLNREYPRAPMTPSFWNKKTHDFGFEKPTAADSVRARHHARFWKTDYKTEEGEKIYVGTVSLDTGVKWGITHKISPDIDTERELLFSDLRESGAPIKFKKYKFVKPILGQNFTGDPFFTDGEAYVILLD